MADEHWTHNSTDDLRRTTNLTPERGPSRERTEERRGADREAREPHPAAQTGRRSRGTADDPVKVAVIYYSATGTVHELAQGVAKGARDAGGSVRVVKVREIAPPDAIEQNAQWRNHIQQTRSVPTATVSDLQAADVVLLGTPTRFGHVSSQLQAFIDTWGPLWGRNAFEDKVFAAFTSSATAHGGQETTLMSIYTTVCHLGGIIVPPGYTDPAQFATGNPYGASSTSDNGQRRPTDADLQSAWITGHRATTVAAALRAGRQALDC